MSEFCCHDRVHGGMLLEQLYHLQQEKTLCDTTIHVRDGQIKVHGIVLLASKCSVFASLALDEVTTHHHVHYFREERLSTVQRLVELLYTGYIRCKRLQEAKDLQRLCYSLGLGESVSNLVEMISLITEKEEKERSLNMINSKEMKTPDLVPNQHMDNNINLVIPEFASPGKEQVWIPQSSQSDIQHVQFTNATYEQNLLSLQSQQNFNPLFPYLQPSLASSQENYFSVQQETSNTSFPNPDHPIQPLFNNRQTGHGDLITEEVPHEENTGSFSPTQTQQSHAQCAQMPGNHPTQCDKQIPNSEPVGAFTCADVKESQISDKSQERQGVSVPLTQEPVSDNNKNEEENSSQSDENPQKRDDLDGKNIVTMVTSTIDEMGEEGENKDHGSLLHKKKLDKLEESLTNSTLRRSKRRITISQRNVMYGGDKENGDESDEINIPDDNDDDSGDDPDFVSEGKTNSKKKLRVTEQESSELKKSGGADRHLRSVARRAKLAKSRYLIKSQKLKMNLDIEQRKQGRSVQKQKSKSKRDKKVSETSDKTLGNSMAKISKKSKKRVPKKQKDDDQLKERAAGIKYHNRALSVCYLCDIQFDNSTLLKKHYNTNHTKVVKCHRCEEMVDVMNFTKHYRQTHLVCHTCGFKPKCTRKNEAKIAEHYFKAHGEIYSASRFPILKCTVENCQYRTLQPCRLTQHNKMVHQPKEHICDECGIASATISNLRLHKEAVHPKEEQQYNFVCNICSKRFRTKGHLSGHMRFHNKELLCHLCSKCCSTKTDLAVHMYTQHNIISPDLRLYQCQYCDYKLYSSWAFKSHVASKHGGSKDFVCEECGKSFYSGKNLRDHRKIHNGTKYRCPIEGCNFTTVYKSALYRKHIPTIHTEKDIKNSICHLCDYRCKNNHTLKTHIRLKHKVYLTGQEVKQIQAQIQPSVPNQPAMYLPDPDPSLCQ